MENPGLTNYFFCIDPDAANKICLIKGYLLPSPPKSSRFASAVLRTCDFVSIAPGKANACFAGARFSLERDKFQFAEHSKLSVRWDAVGFLI